MLQTGMICEVVVTADPEQLTGKLMQMRVGRSARRMSVRRLADGRSRGVRVSCSESCGKWRARRQGNEAEMIYSSVQDLLKDEGPVLDLGSSIF